MSFNASETSGILLGWMHASSVVSWCTLVKNKFVNVIYIVTFICQLTFQRHLKIYKYIL